MEGDSIGAVRTGYHFSLYIIIEDTYLVGIYSIAQIWMMSPVTSYYYDVIIKYYKRVDQ